MTPRAILHVMIGAIVLMVAHGCSPNVSWSDAERKNAEHFIRALEAMQRATRLVNAAKPGVLQLGIEEIMEHQRTALAEARLVSDTVLDKAHPQLRDHFRSEFQRGLELVILSEETGLQSKDGRLREQIEIGTKGLVLLDKWVDWLNSHRAEIRIPEIRKAAR